MLSPEQTTLVLREELADLDHRQSLKGRAQRKELGLGAAYLAGQHGLDGVRLMISQNR